jgi:hypothetical protein
MNAAMRNAARLTTAKHIRDLPTRIVHLLCGRADGGWI